MKKIYILILLLTIYCTCGNCQIRQNNWLLSGNISYYEEAYHGNTPINLGEISRLFEFSPVIGYFIKDKFAMGCSPTFYNGYKKGIGNSNAIYIGPFVRYYCLQPDKTFNIISQVAYKSLFAHGRKIDNIFSFAGGPVVYFNNNVGLEFLFEYDQWNLLHSQGTYSEIHFKVGFQYHLQSK